LREIVRNVRPEEEEKMMSIFAEEKKKEGRQEGEQLGILKGTAKTLLRQMTKRFGPQPDVVASRIQSADERTLEKWTDRILDATTLDDVFA
jgi:predicted transposase YdaD